MVDDPLTEPDLHGVVDPEYPEVKPYLGQGSLARTGSLI